MGFHLTGLWQDGASSASLPAQLTGNSELLTLTVQGQPSKNLSRAGVKVSPKLGRTPRYIQFAELSGQLETSAHEQLELLLSQHKKSWSDYIHQLEHSLLMVLMATLITVGLGVSYFLWGIPAVADLVADKLPESLLQEASDETLMILNKRYFSESQLDEAQQASFRDSISKAAPDYDLTKLHIVNGGDMGANALALPDGTIVFTDQLILLADGNEAQLLGVFGHELGHIVHKHSLRQILQNSAISLTIALIGGDTSALGDIVLTLPIVFSQLAFSRDFELEADSYGVQFLIERGYDKQAFADMLTKLYNSHCDAPTDAGDVTSADSQADANEQASSDEETSSDGEDSCADRDTWLKYLSTHPHLDARIQRVSEASH
ncbi:M48 family metallopeptidase [Simiduia curdlanivorans]|uniref:M48 family metallopeptidase n=1 Tax=Simiduia curdlanivorans TaxID=1492769 RepID=A0ABV8V744_9GAMM|nr:M48 family metallopeptidase [Simiduia curdlanivorans]MDN3638392.1 M48 family metallopeptidase [Simiduia curdlanivorans]